MELKEKELKKKMVAALADAKIKNSSKEKSSSSVAPPEGEGREVITLPDSDVSAESPAARPTPGDGQASEPKKRKAVEPARPVRASSRLRTEEKPAETPASKGSLPATPSPADPKVTPRRELPCNLPTKRPIYFLLKPPWSNTTTLLAAPPKSLADMMRSVSRPGARVPAFKDMSVNNQEDYLRFAEKMLFEFNSSVAHYEEQLFVSPSASEIGVLQARISELEKEVKKLRSSEASNRAEVEKAVKFNKRLRTVEGDLQIAESSLETCQDKLQLAGELYLKATTAETEAKQELQEIKLRNQLLEAGNSSEMERVRREERRKTRAELRSTIDQIGAYLLEHDRMIPHAIRAAEITANRMQVEEIERGEIADLKEELETLKADELTAQLEAEKVKNLTFDPTSFTALLADTPPELGPDPAPTTLMIEEPATDPPAVPNQELEAIKPGLSKEVREMSTPESGGALVGKPAGPSSARSGDCTADPELN
ncbi:protein MLP1 homolog [Capsella rubella]|uniref:protein MLP1 homolog n=1 Tax=Capsella rubella TaxID=81985 RepID=UPI000CD547A9|nr:protein MLP1 homolog [Capsella rubella]